MSIYQFAKCFCGLLSVSMARGKHLFPYRTQQLSLAAVTILGKSRPGKIARCRIMYKATRKGGFLRNSKKALGLGHACPYQILNSEEKGIPLFQNIKILVSGMPNYRESLRKRAFFFVLLLAKEPTPPTFGVKSGAKPLGCVFALKYLSIQNRLAVELVKDVPLAHLFLQTVLAPKGAFCTTSTQGKSRCPDPGQGQIAKLNSILRATKFVILKF